MITKNLPLLLNLAYYGFNRGLDGGDFAPKLMDGFSITYCNQFIMYLCDGLGYEEFGGKNANEIFDFMSDPKNGWLSVDEQVAQSHANNGAIVLAGWKNPTGHGHVCLVLPGILEKSGSYGRAVPKVCNIGKDVFFGKKLSFAFAPSQSPTLFVLSQMI